jgi:hypothetical protein
MRVLSNDRFVGEADLALIADLPSEQPSFFPVGGMPVVSRKPPLLPALRARVPP